MKTLSFEDPRWETFKAGYRVPVDLRTLLRRLEEAEDPEEVWPDLWQELYHQGDVGEGSFAAVPHIVRIHQARGVVDWNAYSLVATIELARDKSGNPDVPEWLKESYIEALGELVDLGLEELRKTGDEIAVRSILGLLAISKGSRTFGRILIELEEDEAAELLSQAFGEDALD
jgi:hypothetical protein